MPVMAVDRKRIFRAFLGDFSCQPNTDDDDFSGHYKTEISHALHPASSASAASERTINTDIRGSFHVSFALHP